MVNSLGLDLRGNTVIMRSGYQVMPGPNGASPVPNKYRVLAVPPSKAGEGAFPDKDGHMMFGYWLDTMTAVVVDATDVERLATRKDVRMLPCHPSCLTCQGTGSIVGFQCTVCKGTGHYTPLKPLEVANK